MAMTASKGAVDADDLEVEVGSEVRSEVEPSRSAAAPTMPPVEVDWTCEAE